MDDLKSRLRKLRMKRGLSGAKLAKMLDTRQSKISDIETGKVYMKAEDLPRYAEALNTTVTYLLTGYDPKNEPLEEIGLSNNAVNILRKTNDDSVGCILSSIIEHRLFFPLMKNIEILSEPDREFNRMFADSVLLHLTHDLPYVDSPEQIRSAYMYQTVKLFEQIIKSITKGEKQQ